MDDDTRALIEALSRPFAWIGWAIVGALVAGYALAHFVLVII